jgi:hypothetical protein
VFASVGARETRPFLGDSFCFRIVARLASGAVPLVGVSARSVAASTGVRLTEAGARVLAGEDDYIRLNGVDRWIGGAHLAGTAVHWRWSEGREGVVPTANGEDDPVSH